MFKEGTEVYSYEVVSESSENVMYINYLGASYVPNVALFAEVILIIFEKIQMFLELFLFSKEIIHMIFLKYLC